MGSPPDPGDGAWWELGSLRLPRRELIGLFVACLKNISIGKSAQSLILVLSEEHHVSLTKASELRWSEVSSLEGRVSS